MAKVSFRLFNVADTESGYVSLDPDYVVRWEPADVGCMIHWLSDDGMKISLVAESVSQVVEKLNSAGKPFSE